MSTSLHWSRVNNSSTLCYGCSRVLVALEKAFGGLPMTLTDESIPKLQGMEATWTETATENPYEKLIQLILEHGAIQVSASH